ncbi:MAG: phage holin family protein [Sphingomonas sp.]|nr:phage holin family protein [Sphingomonas sp.]RZV45318.1 MAG: phage holin family protein [Sphingomonadaceae bacterium]
MRESGEPKPAHSGEDAPIEDLLGRVVGDARDLAEAELALVKAKAVSEVTPYRTPMVLFVLAALFFTAAITTFCITLALWLGELVGPLGGGLIATGIALLIAGILALTARGKIARLR